MKAVSLQASVFCFPTESEEKVKQALATVINEKPVRAVLKGAVAEEIVSFTVRTEKNNAILNMFSKVKHLVNNLNALDEEGGLHIRVDKQRALQGELVEGKGIKIVIKFTTYPFNIDQIRSELEKML